MLLPVFYASEEIVLWQGWKFEGINVYTKNFKPKIELSIFVSPGSARVIKIFQLIAMNFHLFEPDICINRCLLLCLIYGKMLTLSWLDVFHVAPLSLSIPYPYNPWGCPEWNLTKEHCVWNQILLMPHYQVNLVNVWAVPSVLLISNPRSLEEVLLFGPEVTLDLSHFCIHVVEENIVDDPLGRILMDPAVSICNVFPDLWDQAEKPRKNGRVTLYDTASCNIFLLKVPSSFLSSLSMLLQ